MWMELQGKKTTHDFLSLYKDLSFQHPDLRPPSQGFYLKTNDFLQQLERAGKNSTTKAATTTNDLNVISATAGTEKTVSVEHVLPGGIGTYSISHVPAGYVSRAVVKPEWAAWGELPPGSDAERNSETNGVVVGNTSRDCNSYTGVGFTLWEEPQTSRDKRSRGPQQHWPSAFAAPSSHSNFASLSSSKRHLVQEKLRFMDAAASKSNKGFADDDEDDESDFGKRDEPSRRELSVRVDRKSTGSGSDQKATTPRSKHSATEQRRRSKINDRFQILRDLIPHSDQKRDKASFLLEVIEYIQFLQEKVQKYESSYPGWNQDNAKLMPWVKIFFRSFWKNARKNSQGTGESLLDHSQVIKNSPAQAGFVFSGDNTIPGTTMLANTQSLVECDNTNAGLASKVSPMPVPVQQYVSVGKGGGLVQPHPRLVSDSENTASQSQAQWPTDCTITSSMLNEQEELTVEDGTISVSSVYSQGLLTALTQSLQNSGIDLSQSTISVQINLGKRAINKPTCSAKDHDDDDPLSSNHLAARDSRAGSSGEESEEPAAKKRRKSDKKKS